MQSVELEGYDVISEMDTAETVDRSIHSQPQQPSSTTITDEMVETEESTLTAASEVVMRPAAYEAELKFAPASLPDTDFSTIILERKTSETPAISETFSETQVVTHDQATVSTVEHIRESPVLTTEVEETSIAQLETDLKTVEQFQTSLERHTSEIQMPVHSEDKVMVVIPSDAAAELEVKQQRTERVVSELAVPLIVTPLAPDLLVMDGQSMVLQCQFEVQPMKEAVWFHENEMVLENEGTAYPDCALRCQLMV